MTRGRVSVHCSGMMENQYDLQYDLQYDPLLMNPSNTSGDTNRIAGTWQMRCNDWCSESREEVIQGFSLPCYPQFTAATWRPQKLELQLNEMLENTNKDKTQNLQPLKHPVAKWQHEMILSCREEGGSCLECLPVIQQNVGLPDLLAGESHRVYAWIIWHVPLEVRISPFLWKTQTSH